MQTIKSFRIYSFLQVQKNIQIQRFNIGQIQRKK